MTSFECKRPFCLYRGHQNEGATENGGYIQCSCICTLRKIPLFMEADLILIVTSTIIIIMMNTDKKIISFYLEFSKTRKIDEF